LTAPSTRRYQEQRNDNKKSNPRATHIAPSVPKLGTIFDVQNISSRCMARVSAVARVALARRVAIPVRRTALICHHMNRPESAQKNMDSTVASTDRRRPVSILVSAGGIIACQLRHDRERFTFGSQGPPVPLGSA